MGKINEENLYDAVIIGGGVAGLTGAIYLARAKYKVLVLEKENFGGQITITDEVVNYPGIEKISGTQLTEVMKKQAKNFGSEFSVACVKKISDELNVKKVETSQGDFYCHSVLVATGAHPIKIGFKGEEEHQGRGVAYCATCDGEFFTGKDVFVIGGGFAAAEESVFLTKFARHVTILVREEDFTCAASVADKAKNHEKITVVTDTVVEEVGGDGRVDYIRYKNIKSGKETEFKAKDGEDFGVFVFVGYAPETECVKGILDLNEQKYVITNERCETSAEGIFAAGDVCVKVLRQIVTATGEAALAATEMEKYISKRHEETGLCPKMKENENSGDGEELFDEDMTAQLSELFEKAEKEVILALYLDDGDVSKELRNFVEKLAKLTEKIKVEIMDEDEEKPCVKILTRDGKESGLEFHGVPSGHEFTSFVLGIYNVAGPGQKIEKEVLEKIKAIKKKTDIKILVSLSCTMCPEVVKACQRAAAENENITAAVYDIRHFENLKKKYSVMSVPCVVINDKDVFFGKKNLEQITEILAEM